MKFLLTAFLALVAVAQGAPSISGFRVVAETPGTGDFQFGARVDPDGQSWILQFSITGQPRFTQKISIPRTTPPTTEQAFNVTGVPAGNHVARVVLLTTSDETEVVGTEQTLPLEVRGYSKITVLTPELTPAKDNQPPTARLKAKVEPSPADADVTVTFKYGAASGNYPNSISGQEETGRTNEYFGVAPASTAPDLERGVTYHYRVEVVTEGSEDLSVSPNSTFTTAANRPPVPVADILRVSGDRPTTMDVGKNDRDPEDDTLTVISVTQGTRGRVELVDGKVRYTPFPDSSGGDTFTYTIQDSYNNPDTTADERKTAVGTVTVAAPGLVSRGLHSAELKDADGNVVGLIRLFGTGGGSVSGKVQLYNKTYAVQGQIDENGRLHFTIPRGEDDPLQMEVDYEGEGEGAFDVSIGTLAETWEGTAIPYTITNERRDELVGRYTIEFPAPSGDGLPQGIGYAEIDVKPWGEVTFRGRLGDGTKYSAKGVLGGSDTAPVVSIWATPDDSRLYGAFNLGANSTANLSGPLRWYRSPDGSSEFFPDGFYTEISAAGSRFTPPDSKNRTLEEANRATLTLRDGNIANPITQQLEISKSDRITYLNDNPYNVAVKFDRDKGTFSGQFDHPFDDSRKKFYGVLIQSQNKASGVFTGVDQSGAATLTAGITTPPPTPTPTPPPTTPTIPNIPGIPTIPGINDGF